jgi:hypothetical protein
MRKATQELRDASVRAFLDQIQQPGVTGYDPSNMDLQRAAAKAIHQQAAQLADTMPPREPPTALPAKQPKPHQLVRWHRDPARVTKLCFDNLEAARNAALALHWAAFYRYAIMCGRDTVETRNLEEIAA